MAELKEGIIGGAVNLYFIYKFLRILTTPWEKTDAFKLGVIGDNGKILKKKRTLKTSEEKESYTIMHRLVWKLKRLMEKVPFGKSRLASYAAALWLIKEEKIFYGTDEELQESFLTFLETDWKNDALILKENYEGDMDKQTYNRMKETWASGFAKKVHADTKKQARKEKLARMKKKKGEEVDVGEGFKDLPPHLQKMVKQIEKKQREWKKAGLKTKTFVYNPETGKPDLEVKEKAPPGWEGTVKAMKKKKEIDNPYSLAWYLKNKGAKPHIPEEVEINEALKSADKKVVDSFYDEKEDERGKALSTDGKTLWIGGSKAAEWKNGKIVILHAPTGQYDQSVFKYMRKSIPKLNFVKEEVEIDEDAKMGKQSDDQLRKIYKKAAAMDQSSPANKSFTKRIEKEMKKRGMGEEVETEASTYRDKMKDDEKKKKKGGLTPMSQKKTRWGGGGYGKGEEVEIEEAYGLVKIGKRVNPRIPQHSPGQIIHVGSKKEILKMLKKLKKLGGDGYIMQGVTMKVGDKVKGMGEEVEIDEKKSATGYELYHKTFSGAMQHAYDYAKKKGHIVDPKEIDDKVATGPKKPSSGKTNRYSLKAGRKTVEIQVANLDNKRYELNMYIEGVEIDEVESKYDKEIAAFKAKGGKVKKLKPRKSFKSMFKQKGPKKPPRKEEVEDEGYELGTEEYIDYCKQITPGERIVEGTDFPSFSKFIVEGRAKEGDFGRDPTAMDNIKSKYISAQRKRYTVKDIESIARKWKVQLASTPVSWDNDWEIELRGGITLSYEYGGNAMVVAGWKYNKKIARKYHNKYEPHDESMDEMKPVRCKMRLRGFETAFDLVTMKEEVELTEELPANYGGEGSNVDLTPHKKKKKKKVEYEEFGGSRVYVVSPQRFHDSRLGKLRYNRYEKYVGNDDIGEAIRQYGRANPKLPIILKNSGNGAMLYLKYGKKRG